MNFDSVDKIFENYFKVVAAEPFVYKGRRVVPKTFVVSPNIIRGFNCPSMCGGCCRNFTLDWIEKESTTPPENVSVRTIEANGKSYPVLTQKNVTADKYCVNLNRNNGRCNIHGNHPFSCDIELLRFRVFTEDKRPHRIYHSLYSRGWSYPRVDGGRGAACSMIELHDVSWNDHEPLEDERYKDLAYWVGEVVRKLDRLQVWADHFEIPTRLAPVVAWVRSGAHSPLIVPYEGTQ